MKKVLVLVAVAALAMTSCKKDYTCECTVTSNMPGTPNSSSSTTTGKMKKADAEKKCDEGDASASSGPYTMTAECSIK